MNIMKPYTLNKYPSRILVGSFNETQLRNEEHKPIVEQAKLKHNRTYTITKMVKRKGVQYLDIYLVSNEDYYATDEI